MQIPQKFLDLASHKSPRLHFPPHPIAKTPERWVTCEHQWFAPADAVQLAKLDQMTGQCPSAHAQLREFYSRWNGVALCCLPGEDEQTTSLLVIVPIDEWEEATAEVENGGLKFVIEGLEDTFPPGGYVVIGGAPSEATRLILSIRGEYKGVSTAGKILYLSVDPVLGVGEPVASDFFAFLADFATDPAAFLNRISSIYFLSVEGGICGDVADRYAAQ